MIKFRNDMRTLREETAKEGLGHFEEKRVGKFDADDLTEADMEIWEEYQNLTLSEEELKKPENLETAQNFSLRLQHYGAVIAEYGKPAQKMLASYIINKMAGKLPLLP